MGAVIPRLSFASCVCDTPFFAVESFMKLVLILMHIWEHGVISIICNVRRVASNLTFSDEFNVIETTQVFVDSIRVSITNT